ncbi:hypothetical protein GGI07_005784 [Coemansia sp. Benny D115]|nr:hypothetical protein GGI07_005784 [Coemansia sp. Benny D115]
MQEHPLFSAERSISSQNFAVATKQYYGHADQVTLLQILGGSTGTQIEKTEMEQGIHFITVATSQATRTCTTCLDTSTGQMTELIGISDIVDKQAASQYEQIAISILQSIYPPKALALCGTFPPGLDPTCMANIFASRQPEKTLVFVDAAKDIMPILNTGNVDVLKINASEALDILSCLDTSFSKENAEITFVANRIAEVADIDVVAITDGPHMSYMVDHKLSACYVIEIPNLLANRSQYLDAPALDKEFGELVLNPLGAGDTCSAVMLNLMLEGMMPVEAFAMGLAAASASCLVPMPNCVFDKAVMSRIRADINVRLL